MTMLKPFYPLFEIDIEILELPIVLVLESFCPNHPFHVLRTWGIQMRSQRFQNASLVLQTVILYTHTLPLSSFHVSLDFVFF